MKVLFSVTSMLHVPGKLHFVEEALRSVQRHHSVKDLALVTTWLVINEYNAPERCRQLHQKFPHVTILQKGSHQQGQAHSLNIILKELRDGNYTFWVHFEESWVCVRPFLAETLEFMVAHNNVHQLQLYCANYYLNHTKQDLGSGIEMIRLNSDVSTARPQDWSSYLYKWPLYSLRPSVTRVDFLLSEPSFLFSTDTDLWPVAFEFEFSLKWYKKGGTMCACVDAAVVRQQGHKSTYSFFQEAARDTNRGSCKSQVKLYSGSLVYTPP